MEPSRGDLDLLRGDLDLDLDFLAADLDLDLRDLDLDLRDELDLDRCLDPISTENKHLSGAAFRNSPR